MLLGKNSTRLSHCSIIAVYLMQALAV